VSGQDGESGSSGFSGLVGGGVLWLEKSAAYTANTLEGIIADTAGGAWELKLPLAPSVGDSVSIIDAQGTFATNNLTVDTQGENIQEVAGPLICNINNLNIELVYTGATDGWKVRTFPGYTSGASGYSGYSGTSGSVGGIGVSGTSGGIGTSGTSGYSGYSGLSGAIGTGTSGYSGYSGASPMTYTWVIQNPAAGGIPGPRLKTAKTALRIDSYTTAATNLWFNIEERSTIGTPGSNLLSGDLTAGVTGATTTSFADANLAADNWLWVDITGVSGTVGTAVITLAVQ